MSNVIEKGSNFTDIFGDVIALLIFFALFLVLNLVSMRRYRQV